MKVVNSIEDLKDNIKIWKKAGYTIGLVPTMGYLHEGHKSLIDKASKENQKVVVSIFVNPTQFGPNEDLDKYPKNIERDCKVCEKSGSHLVYIPSPEIMYKHNFSTYVNVENLTEGLCGAKRPGHFRGVCTVVCKLFNLVQPTRAYFGEKDAQQLSVIKRMVEDLNFDIEVVGCPIIREEDGLAKSSRNTYLSEDERQAATVLNRSLTRARNLLKEGIDDIDKIRTSIIEEITKEPLAKIDYIEIVDNLSLKPVNKFKPHTLIAIAVFIGNTRLIDNFTWK